MVAKSCIAIILHSRSEVVILRARPKTNPIPFINVSPQKKLKVLLENQPRKDTDDPHWLSTLQLLGLNCIPLQCIPSLMFVLQAVGFRPTAGTC
jgi:hypothetical protein